MSDFPPGPRGAHLTGNLADFTADPLGFLTACVRDHGDVVALGSRNVLLAHPADVERVLVDRAGAFAKTGARTRIRRQGFPTAMMNSDGAAWRAKRDRLAPGFTRALASTATEVALAETAAASLPTGYPMDPAPAVARLTLRTVTRLMFGRALSDRDIAAVGRLVRSIMDASVTPFVLPRWLPTPAALRMRRALRDVDAVIARLAADPPTDAPVLTVLLAADPPRAELRDELATLLLSGFETTKNAVLWTCHLLARHPDTADQVAEEAEAAGSDALPFTTAVVRESARLYPPAWITSRESLCRTEFGGHTVPAGTTVTVSQWVTHRDPRWFPDPHTFDPTRWFGPATAPRGAYFPFGLGPRACVGAAVATAETVAAVAELTRRFRMHTSDARPRPALSLQPRDLTLRLEPRMHRAITGVD